LRKVKPALHPAMPERGLFLFYDNMTNGCGKPRFKNKCRDEARQGIQAQIKRGIKPR
jgi:hypothetical protein